MVSGCVRVCELDAVDVCRVKWFGEEVIPKERKRPRDGERRSDTLGSKLERNTPKTFAVHRLIFRGVLPFFMPLSGKVALRYRLTVAGIFYT